MSRGVLAGWAALWGSQRPADGLVPLHLLLVNADEAHCRVWIEDAASEGAEMILLPELQACSTGHLDDWLNNHAPHHVAPAHRPFLRRMGVSLTREYSREFLLRDFRNRVKQLVTEEFDGFNR
jgi:hypothetical protein